MKRFFILVLCILSATTLFAKQSSIDQAIETAAKDLSSKIPSQTVACVVNVQSDSEALSRYILDVLSTQLVQLGKQTIVERNNLDEVQKELNFQLSGEVSDESAQSIGQKLGAKTIISGTIEQTDNDYRLRVVAIDVETAAYSYSGYYSFVKDAALERITGTSFSRVSLGVFLEGNMNCSVGAAPGAGFQLGLMPLRSLGIGLKGTASFDLKDIWTFEPAGYLRWYAHGKPNAPDSGFFVQGDGGAAIILRNSKTAFSPMGGLTLGLRFAGPQNYLELYARGGYPFIAGAGIAAGLRF